MNKATIKKFLIYFLTRDIPLTLIAFVFMSTDRREALAGLLPMILFYSLPLTIINGLLFAWPYAYVLKRCAEAEKRTPYKWYLLGLLLLEVVLFKVCVYDSMPLLFVIVAFIYVVAFTWVYFNNTFKERDKKISGSANH
ncbi:hypothetical protein [Chitinophaga sp.]|uniref:hypothetical protein n=1 Tax=Chitinophaga sp. TaxID=1869181 RepID=UPI002F933960